MLHPGYTTIDRIVSNVIRDTGFTDEINLPDIVEWIFIAMEKIGVTNAYVQKVTDGNKDLNHFDPIPIVNGRADLPCDFHAMIGIRNYCTLENYRQSTGTFEPSSNSVDTNHTRDVTFTINNNQIFTNVSQGYLEISYWAFPTDEKGMPMIPDDVIYIDAIVAYVSERIARKLWIQGKLARDVYFEIERHWLFSIKSVRGHDAMPTLPQAESLKNQIQRMVQHSGQAMWNFDALGNKEEKFTNGRRASQQ